MSSRFIVEMVGFDPVPSGGFSGGVTCSDIFRRRNVANGSGDDQFDAIRCIKSQIGASGSFQVDFQLDLDRYGVALAAADVVAGIVRNTNETGTATGVLEVSSPNTDGWRSWLDSSGATDFPKVVLPEGAGFAFWGFLDGTYPSSGSNKLLDFDETGGANPVDVEAQFWIRK